MSMHTPGPWQIVKDGWGWRIECPQQGILCHLEDGDPNAADVHLMAAAPDLLKAVDALLALSDAETLAVWQQYGCRDAEAWTAREQVVAYCREVVGKAKDTAARPAAGEQA